MQSEKLGELAKALSKAQGEFLPVVKDKENPFFHSKYADLAACIDATRAALSVNGLAVIQLTKIVAEKTVLETTIVHASGEFITGEYLVQPIKTDPQAMGSALTYARRFSYCGMLSIAAEAEDDGNAASDNKNAEAKQASPKKTDPVPTISENQALAIVAAVGEKVDILESLRTAYKVKDLTDIPATVLPKIMERIKEKLKGTK
jgi:hypothetical protein